MSPSEKARLRIITDKIIAKGMVPALLERLNQLRTSGNENDVIIAMYALAGMEENAVGILTSITLNGGR